VSKPITDYALGNLRPETEPYYKPDGGVPGLRWWIYPTGTKSAQLRFRDIGKVTIAVYDPSATELAEEPQLEHIGSPLTLAAARLLAQKVIRERKRGNNPVADHKARKARQRAELQAPPKPEHSYAAAVALFVDQHARKEMKRWKWTAQLLGLRYDTDSKDADSKDGKDKPQVISGSLCERWANRSPRDIDAHDIGEAVAEARRTAIPGTTPKNKGRSEARARHLDKALGSLFKWLHTERIVADNPHRDLPRPENAVERERFLSDQELRWLLLAADEIDAPRVPNAPRPFRALIYALTQSGCRLREVAESRREEWSADLSALNLPASRTKNGRAFSVPLPEGSARRLIASLPQTAPFVLSTNGGRSPISGFSKMKARLDGRMREIAKKEDPSAVIEPWKLHDIRRSTASGMQRLGIRHEVIERALNHVSGKFAGIGGLYQRDPLTEQVRAAAERWSQHLQGLLAGEPAKNVVPLRGKRGKAVRKS
jgi:site-specific recombinase XerD